MSNVTENQLEKLVADEYIECYEYFEFQKIKQIGEGASGIVYRATWKNHDFALKSYNKQALEEIVKEVKYFINYF